MGSVQVENGEFASISSYHGTYIGQTYLYHNFIVYDGDNDGDGDDDGGNDGDDDSGDDGESRAIRVVMYSKVMRV